jgi:hypothetical protein
MNITSRQFLKTAGAAALALVCGVTIASAQTVIIEERGRMPPVRVEVIPDAPSHDHHWVPGHWVWRGQWEWIPGHYHHGHVAAVPAEIIEVQPERPAHDYYWVRGHHVWEDGRWVWHRGVWVR